MELMGSEWRELNVMFSDCCVPGEGEHKIMEFLRYSKSIELFNKTTTHCVYSPDADVILLTLTLNLPFAQIEGAALDLRRGGTGTIALRMVAGTRIAEGRGSISGHILSRTSPSQH